MLPHTCLNAELGWSHTKRTEGSSIMVDISQITDLPDVLINCAYHFSTVGQSLCSDNPLLEEYDSRISDIEAKSFTESDFILDSTIVCGRSGWSHSPLKRESAGGPDLVTPNHLKHCGPLVRKWLCQIFNHFLVFETILSQFKTDIIVPVYKGKGKDPLQMNSYRGISLTSVLANVFEFVLLDRILPTLSDVNLPQLNQTAYQKGVSCSEAIFACQETISKFIREGDSVYSCFYDLASAFDTVEYPVLLDHLHKAGIDAKLWRLMKHWYTNISSQVRISPTSSSFPISRGGSVLSPVLFLLVMDPVLLELKSKKMWSQCMWPLSWSFLPCRRYSHPISNNITDCKTQISDVKNFAKSRGLVLNFDKCEAIISPTLQTATSSISSDEVSIPIV